ncbi:MAG: hypothetical protein IT383_05330 [Deltaproteobacteria bacterium]|nr:hypothetical protein [Deltaproteobacteria bacterium]
MLARLFAVALASTLKFIGGPITGVALGLPWWQTGLASAAGMMSTVIVVSLFGEGLRAALVRWRGPPRLFSRRTRRAVRIWRKAGVVGVAFLTPVLFSPIGGAILAASFRPKKRRLWPAMAASALCWGLLMSFVVGQMPHLLP